MLALCVIGWVGYARVMRGQVLKVREYDFVQAARALGAGDLGSRYTHSAKRDPAADRTGITGNGRRCMSRKRHYRF